MTMSAQLLRRVDTRNGFLLAFLCRCGVFGVCVCARRTFCHTAHISPLTFAPINRRIISIVRPDPHTHTHNLFAPAARPLKPMYSPIQLKIPIDKTHYWRTECRTIPPSALCALRTPNPGPAHVQMCIYIYVCKCAENSSFSVRCTRAQWGGVKAEVCIRGLGKSARVRLAWCAHDPKCGRGWGRFAIGGPIQSPSRAHQRATMNRELLISTRNGARWADCSAFARRRC